LSVIVDTAEATQSECFECWADAHQRVFPAMQVLQTVEGPFHGRMWQYHLGPVVVYRIDAGASVIRRTPRSIDSGDPAWLHVALQLRGQSAVSQHDRASALVPGNLTSYSSSEPYEFEALTPFELLVVNVPQGMLQPHADRARRRTARSLPSHTGIGRVVKPFFLEVLRGLEDGAIREDDTDLAESVLHLVHALHAERDGTEPLSHRSSHLLRIEIQSFIDMHLGDPSLSRDMIARSHFISVSYLDKLFEAEGMSVWQYIREKRLDRCRRDLADRRLATDSILEIAMRWGFSSAPHFSRSFRAAFGQPPRDFRRAASKPSAA
jgi:AraC-like DNA-binding protein